MLALNNLKKKYGGSLAAVMAKKDELQKHLLDGDSFEDSINRAKKALAQQRSECGLLAEELSAARKKNAAGVISGVVNELKELGMPYAQFDVRFLQTASGGEHRDDVSVNDNTLRASMKGIDEVEFYINTNKGEELKPLVKVASGGEVSRVMLSLKSILAKNDRLPLLIFDEIDTGVSGRIAQRVGLSLKNLAAFHQIIAITHLPQIAGLADQHYTVEKSEQEGRMSTSIRRLTDKERVNEVAKLISGEHITETSLKSARELIKH
jgi:DNA repair protein RecN (Recombination protein N)